MFAASAALEPDFILPLPPHSATKIRDATYRPYQGDLGIITHPPFSWLEGENKVKVDKMESMIEKPKKKTNYKRESLEYQKWTFYCVLFIAVLAAVLFLRILFFELFS